MYPINFFRSIAKSGVTRFRFLFFWLLLAPVTAALAVNSQLTAVTSIVGELRVGITDSSIPFSYTTADSDGPVGHQVDLANQLARDMGVEIGFRTADLETLIEELSKGNIDIIMAGTPMNIALAKRAAFTRPWGRTGVTPVVRRKAVNNFRDWSDLRREGVRIGSVDDATVKSVLATIAPQQDFQVVENSPAAIEALVDNRIDVYLTNTIEASVLNRIDERVAALFPARAAARRPLACLVRIDDPIWLNYVNTWLAIKQETGFLASLARKWGLLGQVAP